MSELKSMTEFLARTGARGLALQILDHFGGMAQSIDHFAELCEASYHANDFDRSSRWCLEALKSSPSRGQKDYLLSMLANAHHRAGRHTEAISALDSMSDSSCMMSVREECEAAIEHQRHLSDTGYWGDALASCHVHSADLARWIGGFLDPRIRVNDLGCGNGFYLRSLAGMGFSDLAGYEGKPPAEALFAPIRAQDLSEPFEVDAKGSTIFLEVGEHVPARFQEVVLDNVCGSCSDRLVMSWATRDQLGVGHVNCLDVCEVRPMVERRGLEYMEAETAEARGCVRDGCGWFAHNLMVFRRLAQ